MTNTSDSTSDTYTSIKKVPSLLKDSEIFPKKIIYKRFVGAQKSAGVIDQSAHGEGGFFYNFSHQSSTNLMNKLIVDILFSENLLVHILSETRHHRTTLFDSERSLVLSACKNMVFLLPTNLEASSYMWVTKNTVKKKTR